MDFSNTSISPRRPREGGFTLIEVQVAVGLGVLILSAVMGLILFSARSFAALTNYIDLDNMSRNALDEVTSEIRQADTLLTGTDQSMTFLFRNPTNAAVTWNVTYAYDPASRVLRRTQGGNSRVLLDECDFLTFSYFKRNPVAGSYDQYPTAPPPLSGASAQECKLVQLRWICSRTIMQQAVNTESVQSARVVIRKQ